MWQFLSHGGVTVLTLWHVAVPESWWCNTAHSVANDRPWVMVVCQCTDCDVRQSLTHGGVTVHILCCVKSLSPVVVTVQIVWHVTVHESCCDSTHFVVCANP